jgi:hypothetical protein
VVKEFLSQRGVSFVLKDLNKDLLAREEFLRAGYFLPPVTVIDNVAVAGYDPVLLDRLLSRGEDEIGAP